MLSYEMNSFQTLARIGCAITLSFSVFPNAKALAQNSSLTDEIDTTKQNSICAQSSQKECHPKLSQALEKSFLQDSDLSLSKSNPVEEHSPTPTTAEVISPTFSSIDPQISKITQHFDLLSAAGADRLKSNDWKAIAPTRSTLAQTLSEGEETAGNRPRLRRERRTPDDPVFRPRGDILLEQGGRYGPGISVLTPTAFGKSWRTISIGGGFQERTRFSNTADGAVGVGFGLGDAEKLVGLDVNITFTDLSDFFNRGIVSFKLHRRLPQNFAVALGVNDALTWGNSDLDGPSPFGVVSKVIKLRNSTTAPLSRLSLSLGAGTGRYRTILATARDTEDPNVFGSAALRVVDPINIITEWTGQDLTVGMSVRPFPKLPLVITPAFTDITGNAGDGWRFILGAGYVFQF